MDLDAYFQRIGYSGPRTATLDTLRSLHLDHPQAIPFENLDSLLRISVRLDLAAIQDKLIVRRRGGYCFEQNSLLAEALRILGFRVTQLAARVVWGAPADALRPRTHMLLKVDLDSGPFIADVGFGGAVLTAPLRLEPEVEQKTPHGTFRLVGDARRYSSQMRIQDEWRTLYHFDLEPQLPPDYDMANWYVSTYPPSHFRSELMVARISGDASLALRNSQLSTYRDGRLSEQRQMADAFELRVTLEEVFGLTLPDSPELGAVLNRAVARPL
jgi:N-hydroxyarylamine O-acetyltransferase